MEHFPYCMDWPNISIWRGARSQRAFGQEKGKTGEAVGEEPSVRHTEAAEPNWVEWGELSWVTFHVPQESIWQTAAFSTSTQDWRHQKKIKKKHKTSYKDAKKWLYQISYFWFKELTANGLKWSLTAKLSLFFLTKMKNQQSQSGLNKRFKTFWEGISLHKDMKQSLVGLLSVSLKGQLIIQNSSKVLILAECLNWKPLYGGWWRSGRPSRKIKLHILHFSPCMSAQSELMPRMRRSEYEEEQIKAGNLKRVAKKNKRS